MDEETLEKSDPRVDTQRHKETSVGGCGGLFNPCPEAGESSGGGCGMFGMFACNSDSHVSVGCGSCRADDDHAPGEGVLIGAMVALTLARRRRRRLGHSR
jgi:MYXO-CTERM domain-containing protein